MSRSAALLVALVLGLLVVGGAVGYVSLRHAAPPPEVELTPELYEVRVVFPGATADEVNHVADSVERALFLAPGKRTVHTVVEAEHACLVLEADVLGGPLLDRYLDRLPSDLTLPADAELFLTRFPREESLSLIVLQDDTSLGALTGRAHALRKRLELLPEVRAVELRGASQAQIQVHVTRERLVAFGLSAGELNAALLLALQPFANSQVDLERLGEAVLLERDGAPVLLKDLAQLEVAEAQQVGVRWQGRPAVLLTVYGGDAAAQDEALGEEPQATVLSRTTVKHDALGTHPLEGGALVVGAERLSDLEALPAPEGALWVVGGGVCRAPHERQAEAWFLGAGARAARDTFAAELGGRPGIRSWPLVGGVKVELSHSDPDVLAAGVDAVLSTANELAEVRAAVRVLPREPRPDVELRWNAEALAERGLSEAEVARLVREARAPQRLVPGVEVVIGELPRAPAELGTLPVPTPDGGQVPLRAVAEVRIQTQPREHYRRESRPTAVIRLALTQADDALAVRDRLRAAHPELEFELR